ncbi:TonB-dependent receptor plug domain-containing protein [Novosphingobium rosa]|uniref:TonB-dependent receptor plug domain-containing protein n=1 Tax=Novosphingobium rosa TaxID=76978 RepID=UPI000ACA1231|nr:TonB-dependent receptor [Novosphingobium rosa]
MRLVTTKTIMRVALAASTMLATPALAQQAEGAAQPAPAAAPEPAAAPAPEAGRDIIVTGSRITSSGFSAPTPTQVLNSEAIAKNAQPNIFTTIAQLPSLTGSTGATVGANGTSTGVQGLSTLSLRGLQPIRTLTLIDGQRVVGANVTGVADVSLFPQLLIERVDVVTGGASASYGSDAVGGVVNFVTNTRFKGFKANVQGGISQYGDDGNYTVQMAVGKSFLADRLHVILSGEYSHEGGIPSAGYGVGNDPNGSGPNGRDWLVARNLINRGITNDGLPQYLDRNFTQTYQSSLYGLITAGPLQGTAFDKNGNPYQFQYGSNGVPSKAANGAVIGCYNGLCQGGDRSGNVANGNALMSSLTRANGYGRIGFDIDSNNEIYTTVNVARVTTGNVPNPGSAQFGNLTLQCSNPYVPAAIQAACATNGITSFSYGVDNAIFPNFINVHTKRDQYRFVLGAKGMIPVLGTDWHYDGYYENGTEITDIRVHDIPLMPRYNAAIQAVRGANGTITCANPVAVASGCQPINIIGGATPSTAALNYVEPLNGPFQHTRQRQDVVSFAVNGEPLRLPAGPLSVAFGGEFRHEYYKVSADPYGNGVSDGSSYTADYPSDPLLNPLGGNWYAGNYHNGSGAYSVYEGFLELNAPLFNSQAAGKANLNMAGRMTHYTTSGTVYTWKIGGTWNTPLDGIRLRAVTSRDIRAPNLSELYAAPVTSNRTGTTNPFNNTSLTVLQTTTGNPNLKPEVASNTEAGIVLSHPSWAPHLNLSFDYYRIKIKSAISALDAQTQINLCYGGVATTCGTFNLNDPNNAYVTVQPFNLSSIFTDGFDIEGSYQFDMSGLKLPGKVTLRGLATHVRNFITNTGLPGTIPIQLAGVNLGQNAVPKWKLLMVEDYSTDRFSFTLQQRWFSAGVLANEYIVCQSNCPVSTVNHPTIDRNYLPGALYVDLSTSYKITKNIQAYVKVDNLFNKDAATVPSDITNPGLYDVIGRMYRFGIRATF